MKINRRLLRKVIKEEILNEIGESKNAMAENKFLGQIFANELATSMSHRGEPTAEEIALAKKVISARTNETDLSEIGRMVRSYIVNSDDFERWADEFERLVRAD